jgi:hypothetical protein
MRAAATAPVAAAAAVARAGPLDAFVAARSVGDVAAALVSIEEHVTRGGTVDRVSGWGSLSRAWDERARVLI